MNGFTFAARRSLRLLSAGAVRSEQGDTDAVGVEDDGVSLTPECIPRLLVSLVTEGCQFVIDLVDLRWGFQQEGQSHAIATGWRRPLWVKRTDRLLGIEGQPQAAREANFNVRLPLGTFRSLQTELAIKRKRPCHVLDN